MDRICCETCGKHPHPQDKDDLLKCEYCYTKSYCSAECREQDWTQHAAQCNAIVASDAEKDLGFVPSAYETTATERAWKTQTLPLPNYMMHHRANNGDIVQTVVAAPVGASVAAAASVTRIVPHRVDLSIAQNHDTAVTVSAQAPQALIHAHAANNVGVKLANTRASFDTPTYWIDVSNQHIGFPLAQGTVLNVSAAAQGKTVNIQGTVPAHLEQHWDRYVARLGAGLHTHLEQQLALKGLPSIKRGQVAIVRGVDPATGDSALLAVRMNREAGTAELVDIEIHRAATPAQQQQVANIQRQTYSAHNVDVTDATTVNALVKTMEEHAAFLEQHIGTLKAIEVDADVVNKRSMELAECQDHLRALTAHSPASVETSIEARAAIKYATRDLQPVGALANPFRKRDYCDDFLLAFDNAGIYATTNPPPDNYAEYKKLDRRIIKLGTSMENIKNEFQSLADAHSSLSFTARVSNNASMLKKRNDFNKVRDELLKWKTAYEVHYQLADSFLLKLPEGSNELADMRAFLWEMKKRIDRYAKITIGEIRT